MLCSGERFGHFEVHWFLDARMRMLQTECMIDIVMLPVISEKHGISVARDSQRVTQRPVGPGLHISCQLNSMPPFLCQACRHNLYPSLARAGNHIAFLDFPAHLCLYPIDPARSPPTSQGRGQTMTVHRVGRQQIIFSVHLAERPTGSVYKLLGFNRKFRIFSTR